MSFQIIIFLIVTMRSPSLTYLFGLLIFGLCGFVAFNLTKKRKKPFTRLQNISASIGTIISLVNIVMFVVFIIAPLLAIFSEGFAVAVSIISGIYYAFILNSVYAALLLSTVGIMVLASVKK